MISIFGIGTYKEFYKNLGSNFNLCFQVSFGISFDEEKLKFIKYLNNISISKDIFKIIEKKPEMEALK